MLLEELLGEQGCEIVGPAARLAKAIDLASTQRIDAALLDLNINGKDVYPVAEILSGRGIPFAFVSGYGVDRLDGLYCKQPMLPKPFDVSDLERIVKLVVSQVTQ